MKVILLERVGRYGTIGEEVNVKDGFARNYLLPTGKALRANNANREKFAVDREAIEARNAERREEAAGIASGLNNYSVVMVRQAAETGQLYGSVSARDISEALVAEGFSVSRSQVDLKFPIKTVGVHPVALKLHAEVEISVNVNVARTADEAERQAKGENLLVVTFDDDFESTADLDEDELEARDADDSSEETNEEEETASEA